MRRLLLLIFLTGIVAGDNSTFESSLEAVQSASSYETDTANQGISWGEWTACSRSCGGGISKQQKRCRRKPCKGRPWNIKYKVCNVQPCDKPTDSRAEQCSSYDSVPHSDQLLKWYPYYDLSRPCALICRGEPTNNSNLLRASAKQSAVLKAQTMKDKLSNDDDEYESDDSIIVQLAEKVQDGTKCYLDTQDICINGECMRVGCDMRVGSSKNRDVCGVCGGDGSTCHAKYAWTLESTSACSESCGGGFKIATPICKTTGTVEKIVESTNCDADFKPNKVFLPCNTHPCSTKWLTGDWSKCSVSCGGGSRSRAVFCTSENGNTTSQLADYKCIAGHKPKFQEICNAFSCPMWEAGEWSECSASCGTGVKTRNVECRDGNGQYSSDCDPSQRPRDEQDCKPASNIDCPSYGEKMTHPLMQSYPPAPVPEKLIDQPVPSQSTFIPDEWSPCSVTCGDGYRHRQVHCKIFLEFSRMIAKLPDHQCSGPKPVETEDCSMPACGLEENSLAYRIDTVGDSSYAESSLTDVFRSSSSAIAAGGGSGIPTSSGATGYETNIKVASGSSVKTSYSWKEIGYTDCSATCLGGVQDLIITCIRDDTGKAVTPLLCSPDTKPESRIRVCNDHPCPPRWNTSDFTPCASPCGLGIQTREVTCIHEVTRGTGNTVAVPNHMCPQPPPVDRQYCNVWDCPVEWHVGDWGKCSKTCDGGVKRRKVSCEQVMAQGRKDPRSESDCSSPKPRSEKECNSRACDTISAGARPIISFKNTTYIQDNPNQKVNLDIGGQATIFQGTPVIKIRCPVKKFDKAHIIWRKDHEELRKSRKHKINKKGALKIVDIDIEDSGVYSCWAGQTNAAMHLKVKPKPRDLMSNEEVLRSGNAVHQRQGLSSAPVNSEPYSVYSEESQETRQDNQKSQKTTEKPRKKKKQSANASPSGSTGKYEDTGTPLHQSYWPFQESTSSDTTYGSVNLQNDQHHYEVPHRHETRATTSTATNQYIFTNGFSEPSYFDPTHADFDPFRSNGNTAIPDNTFGPDEERIFIDDDPFEAEETVFAIEHNKENQLFDNTISPTRHQHETQPTVTMVNRPTRARHHHGSTLGQLDRNQRGARHQSTKSYESEEIVPLSTQSNTWESEEDENLRTNLTTTSEEDQPLLKTTDDYSPSSSPEELEAEVVAETSNAQIENETIATPQFSQVEKTDVVMQEVDLNRKASKDSANESLNVISETSSKTEGNKNITPVVLSYEDNNREPTIGSVPVVSRAKDDLIFEWVTTEWSRCSQTCGGGGFQMRGAQCTVRSAKNDTNSTQVASRTVIGASLCEDAGYPVPEKVRACGTGRCPQWYSGEWSPCESSRCFNWKTAMQRREVACRLTEETDDKVKNSTSTDSAKCDETMRPPQRQECYNDACKGVWRVGEWSECSASCEEDGIKYRILQCVWFGTKKPAGNACRDIPRPPVMKTCRGLPCTKSPDECKDHSQLCGRVKLMGMCRVPLYGKQCCKSCRQERHI
ncbi:protein madd-4 isoform X2 [Phymastichus coffea]|uniref:protein madd-4 isoform X2 n=1 Tax=Phymastichus coffea TaxID=108790 RepID=UPI00273CDF92|nr:protein madd-4 isoform X2 [Phymastichus coffea]